MEGSRPLRRALTNSMSYVHMRIKGFTNYEPVKFLWLIKVVISLHLIHEMVVSRTVTKVIEIYGFFDSSSLITLDHTSGLAGVVTSLAPSPNILVSAALDRYLRVHSIYPLADPGKQQDNKGDIVQKVYVKSIPTVVVWDQDSTSENPSPENEDEASKSDDDVWEGLQNVDDDDASDGSDAEVRRKRRNRR